MSVITLTDLPPWALPGAVPGAGRHERDLPPGTRAGLPTTVHDRHLLLAACWLAVLARCTGEPEVATALTDPDGRLHGVGADVRGLSWAELVDCVRTELATRPVVDGDAATVVDAYGAGTAGRLVLSWAPAGGRLRVDHDTAWVSHGAAGRVLDYLRHAVACAVAGPHRPADLTDLLGAQERHRQLHDLCGPRVANGPDGFVSAFRARAMIHPDAVAVRHHGHAVGYAELDAASDGVARRLVEHGVASGDRVAVVTDRHTDWVVALLGVLKAGGVYLPVRPDFPPARVEDMLRRARCRVALADRPGTELLSGVVALGRWNGTVLDATVPGPDECDLPGPSALSDPAYVYFTSGSTGTPKGALCTHGGMVNHLWAKVDDHDLGPGSVLTQTASQCFDISLWQVCAPLLVGGTTVVVDTEVQLDVPRFVDTVARCGATTIQIVPSYLEVLLAHLEAGAVRPLPLTSVSVTGEPLKASLVRRWFAAMPGVRLVNAYGATEASDDTMHAVLDAPPARDLAIVDVGRPLRNMRVYVVDEDRRLLPEGATGEIVFAGVCVGAGYLNDPERTAESFGDDPYHPGERLYRSGDLGRWLPEGRLEFLGRLDEQIKIRGLRVEIGEVQAALLRVPDIAAAAVVPVGEGNSARLVGCYVSDCELASTDLHDLLSEWLPEYMVPAHYLRLAEIPLNDNGKTDRRRLMALTAGLDTAHEDFEPPATPRERQLATLWAEVLGLPAGRASRHDSFFDLGGTSLSMIHLLMRLGHRLSLTDVLAHPVLRDQARLLDTPGSTEAPALLHRLSGPTTRGRALVCLPDAGGNAVNFRRLADEAAVDVWGVELPGHDLARPDEPLAAVSDVVDRLVDEIDGWPAAPYLVGRGAGAAVALAVAAACARVGTPAAGVVLVWQGGRPGPGAAERVAALSDDEVADLLSRRQAYVEVDGAAPERLPFVARAYRHDWSQALRVLDRVGDPGCPVVEFRHDPGLDDLLGAVRTLHDPVAGAAPA